MDGNGVPSNSNERVTRYRSDGLFRRVSKQVTNQGMGVVFRSDDLDRNGRPDATGILAGDRYEHHYWGRMGVSPVRRPGTPFIQRTRWRLVETRNHVTGGGGYSSGDSTAAVLNASSGRAVSIPSPNTQ